MFVALVDARVHAIVVKDSLRLGIVEIAFGDPRISLVNGFADVREHTLAASFTVDVAHLQRRLHPRDYAFLIWLTAISIILIIFIF